MIKRLVSLLVIAWCLGFVAFTLLLPGPPEDATTDAIVVPTGGAGRIDRGLALLSAHRARRMLVTGVAPGVDADDLAREYGVPMRLFDCCIDLGRNAVDTRSNAQETADWVAAHRYRSVRLVTSNWHVPRARMELAAVLGPQIRVVGDGVGAAPRLATLVNEYDKLLLRRVALWTGIGA